MLLNIAAVIFGFAILVWGSDRFIAGAAAIARNMGVSPLLIGLTIVGFGTSAPEVLVSAMASLQGNPGLAIGNALGSNIANIALILGITALVSPLTVKSNTLKREYPMLLAVSLLALLLMLDGSLDRMDGIILVAALLLVLFGMISIGIGSRSSDPMNVDYDAEIPEDMPNGRAVTWFIIGLALLLLSSRMLIWGAVNIAQTFGVSDLIIGLTIIAIGTSLPELAAGVTSALKNEHDIAIGNIIGSNMYNLLAVLPMPGLIVPGSFSPEIMNRDMPVMIGLTLLMFMMSYGFRRNGRINRFEGLLLFFAFIGYQGMLFLGIQKII